MHSVLVVTGSLRVGGLETVAVNCMRYANRDNLHFTFLVLSDTPGELEKDVKGMGGDVIHTVIYSNPIKHVGNLCKVMKAYGPFDIVHSHVFFNSGLVLLAAKMAGIKTRIAHSHSVRRRDISFSKTIFNNIMRLLLQCCATTVCACSRAAGEYVFGKRYYARHGVLVPNIIDVDRFRFSEEARIRMRRELGIADDEQLVGQVGHLFPAKNPLFLLSVFSRYKEKHKAKLVIVGEGMMRPLMEDKIQELHLVDNVILTGSRTDVPDLLSAMDVFVCTSTNEGLGIVLLEAQANGLPCVCEEQAIVDEIKELGNCSFVSGFSDEERWCEAVSASVHNRNNTEKVKALQNSSFTMENFTRVISSLYR